MFHRLNLRSKFIVVLGLVITVSLTLVFYWMYNISKRSILAQVDAQAKSLISQMLITRRWVAAQNGGGIYVRSGPGAKSSPFVSHLDVTDKYGHPYYFRNPALVSRELSGLAEKEGLYRFHLSSLKLRNPQNKPSDFELKALKKFDDLGYEKTSDGLTRIYSQDGGHFFERVIPLRTEKGCLKCHADQGYNEGDVRGSLGVTIPLAEAYLAIAESRNLFLLSGLGFTVFVLFILYFSVRYIVLNPINKMYLTAQKVEADMYLYDAEFNLKTGDELETLSDAFREMLGRISRTYEGSVRALANAIEARDPYTKGHTERVAFYSLAIGRELGLDRASLKSVELAAVLHDIGKIGIRDSVLNKPSSLIDKELDEMHKHPLKGAKIMKGADILLREIPGVLYHHEKYDGTGYPENLKGEKIPLVARIIAVSDAFDAMTSDRPYRKRLSVKYALSEIKKASGSQFAPDVVAAFERVVYSAYNEATRKTKKS